MFSEIILTLWTCAGLAWWVIALSLVTADRRGAKISSSSSAESKTKLSIFKPFPPLGPQGLRLIACGLESFVAQLDSDSELLLGVHEADRDFCGPFLKRLRIEHPHARLKIIFRSEPDDVANPKIAWQKFLAPHAEGELWLWSDSDIVAPEGFLQAARAEFASAGVKMMTFPYVVRDISIPPALLEAVFVNVEFYPGVLLLRQKGPVDFGLGAGMLFRRDDFLAHVGWNEIGDWLADDFFLGQKLCPVRIGATTLATVPGSPTWNEALGHDLRWAKTIRWNRPLGSFSRLLVMPVLGWIMAAAIHPGQLFAWAGLAGMIQADVLVAALICRQLGCGLTWKAIAGLEFWSLWRIALWFLCWLPGTVKWGDQKWPRPRIENCRNQPK